MKQIRLSFYKQNIFVYLQYCFYGYLSAFALSLSFVAHAVDVSLTFDDFDVSDSVMLTAEERNQRILKVLDEHAHLKTTLFVQGKNVDSERGQTLLKEWDHQGHTIANHTYSHLSYSSPKVSFAQFTQDIMKAESLIRSFTHFQKLFRFPYLHEGNTLEKRDNIRRFFKEHQYQVGYVTLDASDWYVNDRMKARFLKDPQASLKPYRDYYLNHIWDRAQFYNGLSKKVLGREVKHTLLLHYNLLNALFLKDLIAMFESKGWKVISSKVAFKDPVFQKAPKIVPAGNSILWAIAKETGKYDSILRDPGEDGDYEKDAMDRLGL
jgi:peptidoglycan/xylan/chitin deacetylase (PgdA/CDA1 family)